MREVFSIAILTLCCVFASCDDRVVDIIDFEDAGPPPDEITADVSVPEWFADDPVELGVVFHYGWPPSGEPAEFGATFTEPDISSESPFYFVSSQGGLEGDYYVEILLFVDGGGTIESGPVPTVDWGNEPDSPVTLGPGTGTIDLGEVELKKIPPPQ